MDGRSRLMLWGDNGTTLHTNVALTSSGLVLYRNSTVIANYSASLSASTFYYIEISSTIDSTSGVCEVRLNGNSVINFTGNTKSGGTNNSIDRLSFINGGISNKYYDDLYICDGTGSSPYNTFLGDCRVVTLSPTAAGSSTQWTPDTGSNYARVNEVPYSAANYVQSGTSGQRDTYTMADLPVSPGTVLAVQNNIVAKRTDAAAISIKPVIKSGATLSYGSSTSLTTYDSTLSDIRVADPNTSTAWTASGVNALEGGFEVA